MKKLNQTIPAHLSPLATTSPSELPELTAEEQRQAIYREKARRAAILGMLPEQITISPDAAEKLFMLARIHKDADAKTKSYWEKVDKPRVRARLSLEQLYARFLRRAEILAGRPFVVDEHNRDVIHKLCLYFSATHATPPESNAADKPKTPESNRLLQQYGIDTNKGILLAGGIGCGKTTIMRAFSANPLATYRLIPARLISWKFSEHGFHTIQQYSYPEGIPINKYGHTEIGTCFDDLGTEEERKHYGDKVNAMSEILLSRYDNLPFNQTHITTNLNADALEQTYGSRLRSRMREMFNLIHFPIHAPDRRI